MSATFTVTCTPAHVANGRYFAASYLAFCPDRKLSERGPTEAAARNNLRLKIEALDKRPAHGPGVTTDAPAAAPKPKRPVRTAEARIPKAPTLGQRLDGKVRTADWLADTLARVHAYTPKSPDYVHEDIVFAVIRYPTSKCKEYRPLGRCLVYPTELAVIDPDCRAKKATYLTVWTEEEGFLAEPRRA